MASAGNFGVRIPLAEPGDHTENRLKLSRFKFQFGFRTFRENLEFDLALSSLRK
jgi:hypothetical protein